MASKPSQTTQRVIACLIMAWGAGWLARYSAAACDDPSHGKRPRLSAALLRAAFPLAALPLSRAAPGIALRWGLPPLPLPLPGPSVLRTAYPSEAGMWPFVAFW